MNRKARALMRESCGSAMGGGRGMDVTTEREVDIWVSNYLL